VRAVTLLGWDAKAVVSVAYTDEKGSMTWKADVRVKEGMGVDQDARLLMFVQYVHLTYQVLLPSSSQFRHSRRCDVIRVQSLRGEPRAPDSLRG